MATLADRAVRLMDAVLDRPYEATTRGSRQWMPALIASVVLISALHYVSSHGSVELHEIFQRLYYVPIVIAAVIHGVKGGLTLAGLSAVLFVPHVVFSWHGWPTLQLSQYAEVVVFTLVGCITGFLAERLRAQRDRSRRTAVELDDACRRLQASLEERVRADRLVTIGRVASGIAHEIRTPLAGLLGSLEILETDIASDHPKSEFVTIAKKQIERLNRVVTEFQEFAHPPPPSTRPADLGGIVAAAARLARPSIALHGGVVDLDLAGAIPHAAVDAEQVERALLNILLDEATAHRPLQIRITVDCSDEVGRIVVAVPLTGSRARRDLADIFEPFPGSDPGAGLTLAMARRLIENQHGAIRAEFGADTLRYVIELAVIGRPVGHRR